MLVLSRKENESIIIDSDIEVEVLEIRNGRVRLGIRAPQSRRIVRAEVELRDPATPCPAPEPNRKVTRRSLSDSNPGLTIP
ncbi:MAG: carbon storage regulator [Planctomycetaceae bacterium]|nr:carbon storage regulator [Planctomycetaceae bacterium]